MTKDPNPVMKMIRTVSGPIVKGRIKRYFPSPWFKSHNSVSIKVVSGDQHPDNGPVEDIAGFLPVSEPRGQRLGYTQ